MKYTTILFLLIFLQKDKQEDLREINLFNGKFVFSVPKYLNEKGPLISTRQDYKYDRHFFNKDSSIKILINVGYEQIIGLRGNMSYEKKLLLGKSDGLDKKITGEEILSINNRPVLLISCDFSNPGFEMAKWHGKLMVFNTTAGGVTVFMSYGYRNKGEEDKRDLLLKKFIESIKMN
ncbi:hypothetical protein GO495_24795 [Chitinophaga oryziterrae]|uniref:Uncharacterized protein n=1 Tax=Chitinophaga oryziterrae TaxID=1031224 RepID=A0A6N8JHN3_9BACT|nr:hypothetical protein [Chitinophaga oryziterrae]MVT43836.1 hypothetical protein [Chitinophaga oryziterrae]